MKKEKEKLIRITKIFFSHKYDRTIRDLPIQYKFIQ